MTKSKNFINCIKFNYRKKINELIFKNYKNKFIQLFQFFFNKEEVLTKFSNEGGRQLTFLSDKRPGQKTFGLFFFKKLFTDNFFVFSITFKL